VLPKDPYLHCPNFPRLGSTNELIRVLSGNWDHSARDLFVEEKGNQLVLSGWRICNLC
jgi:hypothetical protein